MLRKTKAVEKSIELNWKRRPVAHRTRTSKENKYLALVGFSSTPSPCQLTQPQCQPLILSSLFLADRSLYSLQTYLRGRRSWCKRQQNRMVFSSYLCSSCSSSNGTVREDERRPLDFSPSDRGEIWPSPLFFPCPPQSSSILGILRLGVN